MYLISILRLIPLLVLIIGSNQSTVSPCHPNWQQMGRNCYKLPGLELATWNEADLLCRASGGRLFTSNSPNDELMIKRLRAGPTSSAIWVGANRWSPVNPSAGIRWRSQNEDGNPQCPSFDMKNGKLDFINCTNYQFYMCKSYLDPSGAYNLVDTNDEIVIDEEDEGPDIQELRKEEYQILKVSGGILAGLIMGMFLWIAAGISVVVYLRRRRNRHAIQWLIEESHENQGNQPQLSEK